LLSKTYIFYLEPWLWKYYYDFATKTQGEK